MENIETTKAQNNEATIFADITNAEITNALIKICEPLFAKRNFTAVGRLGAFLHNLCNTTDNNKNDNNKTHTTANSIMHSAITHDIINNLDSFYYTFTLHAYNYLTKKKKLTLKETFNNLAQSIDKASKNNADTPLYFIKCLDEVCSRFINSFNEEDNNNPPIESGHLLPKTQQALQKLHQLPMNLLILISNSQKDIAAYEQLTDQKNAAQMTSHILSQLSPVTDDKKEAAFTQLPSPRAIN